MKMILSIVHLVVIVAAALAATPPRVKGEAKLVVSAPDIPSASIDIRVADRQNSATVRETLSLDGESLSELRL
ncbi:MAG: hypothetical protein IJQ54_04560 [Kiritimatiellae bacterium]|nr:hypothetical protein [Kiritimatiellia bacterium]